MSGNNGKDPTLGRHRRVMVEGICRCNRYTVLKKTGIMDRRGFEVKLPVCTGCRRRESDCDCKYHEGETMFMNMENQKGLWDYCKGKPFFRITGTGDGSIGGRRF